MFLVLVQENIKLLDDQLVDFLHQTLNCIARKMKKNGNVFLEMFFVHYNTGNQTLTEIGCYWQEYYLECFLPDTSLSKSWAAVSDRNSLFKISLQLCVLKWWMKLLQQTSSFSSSESLRSMTLFLNSLNLMKLLLSLTGQTDIIIGVQINI